VTRSSVRIGLAVSLVAAWACGTLKTPTEPPAPTPGPPSSSNPTPNPNPTPTPILAGPAKPTPTPDPQATPDPDPSASPAPPQGAGECRDPLPGPLSQMNVKIHQRGDSRWTLDSTPLVGPDAAYCAKIGFTDGRGICPVRVEGSPEREACELYVVGRAADTGRPGPTWYLNGSLCTGKPGCENHADNQYQVYAYGGGLYKACGTNGVCGDVQVDR
jgi:hypothetical protein